MLRSAGALLLLMGAAACVQSVATPVTLEVFAASSLADAFGAMVGPFQAGHPDIAVVPTFAGSQILRMQIEQGAPADVYVSADAGHVRALERAGLIAEVTPVAANALAVIVPFDNPAGIESFGDLGRAHRLVVGDEAVPVGAYTSEMLQRAVAIFGAEFEARVQRAIVSRESNVRLVRAKVELGEADAAIVYRTDAAATDRVRTVMIPASVNVRATYFAGVVVGSSNSSLAGEWIRFVASDEGRAILLRYGFETVR